MGRGAKKSRRPSPEAIKRAADRAAAGAAGEDVEDVPAGGPLDPAEVKTGRPTKYRAEYAKQARKLCQLGATDFELAEFFGVNTTTVWRWRSEHPAFCNATAVGKAECDERVVRSMYQRAVGYSYHSEKLFCFEGDVTRADVVEHVPPDVNAGRLWLMNRRGDDWKDKQETTVKADEAFLDLWRMVASRRSTAK